VSQPHFPRIDSVAANVEVTVSRINIKKGRNNAIFYSAITEKEF